MVERVKKLTPGALYYDPQWGHPCTTLEIFAKDFPHLQLIPSTSDNLRQLGRIYQQAKDKGVDLHFVYDTRSPNDRQWVDTIIRNKTLCAKKETITKEYKGKVFDNTSIAICTADLSLSDFKTRVIKQGK